MNPQKHLVDQFHKFGITTTYDELRRYRISVASAMEKGDHEIAQFDSKQGLVQTVAENFDTQICSQNGQKSTHGLAMILTQTGCQQQPHNSTTTSQSGRICRLKWKETNACNLSLGEVPVQRYHGGKKPNMPDTYKHRCVATLAFLASSQVSLARAGVEDVEFFREVTAEDPCPEYGGFNTQRYNGPNI